MEKSAKYASPEVYPTPSIAIFFENARKRRADGSTVLSCGVALLRGHEGDNTPSISAKRPKTIEALRAERLAREQHESRRINEVLQRARGSGARPSRQPHPGFG